MVKPKRSLEEIKIPSAPKPFIYNTIPYIYNVDNINPVYVDNNTGEVWQKGQPKGAIVLPDVEVKGRAVQAKENIDKVPKEKGLENPMIDPFLLTFGGGRYSGDVLGDLIGEGLGYAAKPLTSYARAKAKDFGNYARGHVYYNVAPIGYDHPVQRGKAVVKGILSGKKADIDNAPWLKNTDWIESAHAYNVPTDAFMQARVDAWRLYNGFPQKYNTFVPSNNVPGAYQPNLNAAIKNKFFGGNLWYNIIGGHTDIINGSGGGVTTPKIDTFFGDVTNPRSPFSGVMTYEDIWDLHPFSRTNDKFTNKVIRPFTLGVAGRLSNKVNAIGNKLYHLSMIDKQRTKAFREALKQGKEDALDVYADSGQDFIYKWDAPKLANIIRNATINTNEAIAKGEEKLTKSYPFRKLDKKMENFEVGDLTGGRPFKVVTQIPFHRPSGLELIDGKLYPPRLRFGFDPEAIVTPLQQHWQNTIGNGLYIK